MEEHGDIKVTYNPTGSSSGIQAVAEGRHAPQFKSAILWNILPIEMQKFDSMMSD